MPTTKPRYTVTDTGELTEWLDRAQSRWPEVRDRKALLLRLVSTGNETLERETSDRIRAVEETAGALTGVWKPGDLQRLREEWPE